MDPQGQQDEQQHSFQELKNKWAQQALKQEQPSTPASTSNIILPPPIPPKPTSVLLHKVHLEEEKADTVEDKVKAKEDAAKRVSLLASQFEKQKLAEVVTPGNFSNSSSSASISTIEKPPRAINIVNKKTPALPPPPPTTLVSSPPQLYHHDDPFAHPDIEEDEDDYDESSDGDSDIEEEDESEREAYLNNGLTDKSPKEGDNNLIEQVQRAHLQYTKLEESRFIGAPGVHSHDAPAAENNARNIKTPTSLPKTVKKPPPPPPPSKKYHRSAPAPPQPPPPSTTTTAAVTNSNIPMNNTKAEFDPNPATIVDTSVLTSPPILPPRPLGSPMMPQLPPRPSQSTLARAHTIAAHSVNKSALLASPASVYTDNSSFAGSDFEDEGQSRNLKRANTVSAKRAVPRSETLMTSSIYPDFSQATRNAPKINMDHKPFSTGHKGSVQALAASKNVIVTGSNVLRTWDVNTGTVISTIMMDANSTSNNQNNNESNGDRIRAVAFAPCRIPVDEGRYVWVARHDTMLAVVDIRAGGHKVLSKRNDVHMAPILFLLRYGNSEVWSIDDNGILYVWDVLSDDYQQQNPLLTAMPRRYQVTSHAVAATIYGSKLWMSSGRTLAAHAIPIAGSQIGSNDTKSQPAIRIPNDMGYITKLITIPYHPYRIFASHDDGKISIWDTKTMERLQVITVSVYGICTMACVGEYHVWAGYNTGMIYVYDTRPEKWAVVKMWKAHTGAVTQLVVDESSLILDEIKGRLQVISGDSNGFVGVWDGLLTDHWKGKACHILESVWSLKFLSLM